MVPASSPSHDLSSLCAPASAAPVPGPGGCGAALSGGPATGDFAELLEAKAPATPALPTHPVPASPNAPTSAHVAVPGAPCPAPEPTADAAGGTTVWLAFASAEPSPSVTEESETATDEEAAPDAEPEESSVDASNLLLWQSTPPAEPWPLRVARVGPEPTVENASNRSVDAGDTAASEADDAAFTRSPHPKSSESTTSANPPLYDAYRMLARAGGVSPAAVPDHAASDKHTAAVPEASVSTEAAAEGNVPAPEFRPGRRWQLPETASARAETVSRGAGYDRASPPSPELPATAAAAAARFAGSTAVEAPRPVQPGEPALRRMAETIVQQVVKPALQSVGIDPANVSAAMEFVAHEPALSTESADSADAGVAAGATRAVEQVLRTADLMRSAERPGVNLRLDFGESGPLNVQITLRDGCVHALFRSDSPEVRDTIAQAWTAYAQRGEIGGLPLAEPVLLPLRPAATAAAADPSRFSGSAGEQGADGRSERQARSQGDESQAALLRHSRRRAPATIHSPSPVREVATGHLRVHA